MKKSTMGWWIAGGCLALAAGYLLFARGKDAAPGSPGAAAGAASSPAGAPVSVSTVQAVQRDVDIGMEATGTVSALNSVEVRPQVSSTIARVHIREGQFVKAGTLLFTLDSRADEVNVTKARAQLAKDQAALADAQRQLARSRELFAQGFIAQGAVDTNQALVESHAATVAADRAAVEAAQVALSYSRILAPTSGRAGAINVFAGSYVQPGGAPLVTLTQIDPIAVSFSLPQRNLPDALQILRAGGGTVTAALPEGRGSLTGKLQFVDNAVDGSSGTVKVKAVFDNKDQKLWPGAYVSVRLVIRTLKEAVVVPQAAVIQGARGRTVYVVAEDRKVALRTVELLETSGLDAVVKGVRSGERLVVDGRQNVRPGGMVVERAPEAASGAKRGRREDAASAPIGTASPAAP